MSCKAGRVNGSKERVARRAAGPGAYAGELPGNVQSKFAASGRSHNSEREYLAQLDTKKGRIAALLQVLVCISYLKLIWLSIVRPSGVNFISVRERSSMAT